MKTPRADLPGTVTSVVYRGCTGRYGTLSVWPAISHHLCPLGSVCCTGAGAIGASDATSIPLSGVVDGGGGGVAFPGLVKR
jgi:hypothetical protein